MTSVVNLAESGILWKIDHLVHIGLWAQLWGIVLIGLVTRGAVWALARGDSELCADRQTDPCLALGPDCGHHDELHPELEWKLNPLPKLLLSRVCQSIHVCCQSHVLSVICVVSHVCYLTYVVSNVCCQSCVLLVMYVVSQVCCQTCMLPVMYVTRATGKKQRQRRHGGHSLVHAVSLLPLFMRTWVYWALDNPCDLILP